MTQIFDRTEDEQGSGAAIRIGEMPRGEKHETRWGLMLIIFMRVVAGLWVLMGLMHWATILAPNEALFDVLPMKYASMVVFFGVIDLLAAVGLWLAAPWGGILWLLATGAQIFVSLYLPKFFYGGRTLMVLDIILVGLYLFITFRAGQSASRSGYGTSRVFWR